MEKTMLFALFVRGRRNVGFYLNKISKNFEVVDKRVFLLKDKDTKGSYILSFNGTLYENNNMKNVITLHRKKDINVLYTLNALNEVVSMQNDGKLDESFVVDWSSFNNCILITSTENEEILLRKINTELVKIFRLRD